MLKAASRGQAFPRELVHHIEDPDLSAVFQPVLHDVIAPDVIHVLRRTPIAGIESVSIMTISGLIPPYF